MEISKELINHLSVLSRIDISEEEMEYYKNDLQNMVHYFDALNEVDTDGIIIDKDKLDAETDLREDEEVQGLDIESVTINAPADFGGAIIVPATVEEE